MLSDAKWIKSPENKEEACYEFYVDLLLKNKIQKAVLDITCVGMYCAFINGHRVGNEFYTP